MKIKVSLSNIGDAIKQIEDYRKTLEKKITDFIWALTERGVDIAVKQIAMLDAFDTGELTDSVNAVMYVENGKGIIFTDCKYAAFVEFGTGVVGKGAPHPFLPWKYDINEHGESGWVYFDEKQNRFRWTKGMPSRPFMYNTLKELAAEASNIARQVFV